MVGNIKYIFNGMSYKELKNNIKESRRVRAFPLVDNPSIYSNIDTRLANIQIG